MIDIKPIEHKPNGELFRMTQEQFKTAKELIKQRCCNCNDGSCGLFDDICPQLLTSSVCCRWFRWSVLPENKGLEEVIFQAADKSKSKCPMCNKLFFKKSNKQKYCCEECKAKARSINRVKYNHKQYIKNAE